MLFIRTQSKELLVIEHSRRFTILFPLTAGTARLAVWTHPEFRGRGVAPAAVEAACVFGFDALGLQLT